MADKWEAQYQFWNQFGVEAYEENTVPDVKEIAYPYITYQAAAGGFGDPAAITASIYDRNTSWINADRLSDEIEHHIRTMLPMAYDKGRMWVSIGDTIFAQNMGDPEDDLIKRKVLNLIFEFEQVI